MEKYRKEYEAVQYVCESKSKWTSKLHVHEKGRGLTFAQEKEFEILQILWD